MAYIGNDPFLSSQRQVTDFTATSGQDTFTPTGGYQLGYVDVYQNGILLVSGTDYTASNGTDVVLTDPATAGDSVKLVTYVPRGLTDGYTKLEADARYMAIDAVTLPDQTGHSGQFLTTDGTTADWATVDTSNGDTAFSWGDHSTQNYAVTTGDTMTGDLSFGDNVKAQFGASNDLQIYHDGTHSYIEDTGTGNLYIDGANNVIIRDQANADAWMFRAESGGSTNLYHGGSKKIETTSTGVSVTGDMTLSSNGAVNSELRSDYAGLQLGTTSNHYLAFRTNNTEKMRLNTNGNLSVSGSVSATSYTGDGSALTGVGGSTSFGAVGTYAWLIYHASGTGPDVGSTTSGSNIRYKSGSTFGFGTGVIMYRQDANALSGGSSYPLNNPSGTWRNMGPQLAGSEGTSVSHHRTHNLWVRTA